MHCLSFQSREVTDTLLSGDTYFADITKCREQRDYKEDIAQLYGAVPIWVFGKAGERFERERVFVMRETENSIISEGYMTKCL